MSRVTFVVLRLSKAWFRPYSLAGYQAVGTGPAHLIVMMAENGDMEVEVFTGFQTTILTGLTLT